MPKKQFPKIQPPKEECHDCKKPITFKTKRGEWAGIENGVLLGYDTPKGKVFVYKCNECYAKPEGKELKNYQECEVYSRVVGYIRPVQGFNKGKLDEFKQRKTYDKSIKKIKGVETPKKYKEAPCGC